MSLVGFRCPDWVPTAGTENPIAHCLGKCPHPCAAPPLLAAIYKENTENHHTGIYISASMLAGSSCARQTVFERTVPFYELPTKRFWAFRGTHAHSMVERAVGIIEEYGWVSELRMSVDLTYPELPAPKFSKGIFTGKFDTKRPLVITLGGTCDSYNPQKRELWDMKSMADVKAEMMVRGTKPGTFSSNLEDSWVKQLNVYRWLLANTKIPPAVKAQLKLEGELFPAPEVLGIQGISMMNIPRTGADYDMKVAAGRGRVLKRFTIDSVPVWPLEETEAFIREGALQWYRWLALGEPTPVVPEDKSWLCDGCPFNGERIKGAPCMPTTERTQSQENE